MIKTIYTTQDIWEVDTDKQNFIIGIDRVIITDKKDKTINTVIFTDYIVAIETTTEPHKEIETISIGTSD